MASLLILKGDQSGKRIQLVDDRILLGRNRECQVVIDLPAASREHANILRIQGKFYIEDRGSRNGTFVNNQQIGERTELKDNDRIKICDFLCSFHITANALKPLPAGLRTDDGDNDDEQSSSTVEAKVGRLSNVLLVAQPAEKIAALLEISGNLSKALDLDALLPRIAESLFQLFRQADRTFLIMREEATGKLYPKLIKTRRPGGEANSRFSKSIVQQCLDSGQGLLSEDASTDSRFGMAQSIADFRIRSVMCAPLCFTDGTAVGVIQLDTQDRSKKFVEDDLKLLVGVANQAGIALENVNMHDALLTRERAQRDLEIAREVQHGFLPKTLPAIPGYRFYTHYESAQEIGGDYYDFIPLSEGRMAVLLGDVAGKGVPAALLMAKLSAEARFCMLTEAEPARAIGRLNDLLLQAGMLDRFVTLTAAVLDPGKHQVTVINAGHMPPLLYRPGQPLEEISSPEAIGYPLGVMEGSEYVPLSRDLAAGDSILFFTDGITDALNIHNAAFQKQGIRTALEAGKGTLTPADIGERLIKAVKLHASGRSQHDDIALVCFGREA